MSNEHIGWKKEFELGVEEIDLQHRYFLDLVNRLIDELDSGDRGYQQKLIQELNAYVKFHFISEENMMFAAAYPGMEEHRQLHFELVQDLNTRQAYFIDGHITAKEITDFLCSWFMHHTLAEDMKFGSYLEAGKSR